MARTMATDKEEEVAEVFVDSQVLLNETNKNDLIRKTRTETNEIF